MPEIPQQNDRYVNPEGKTFLVLSVHPPYITARRRRGWAVTMMCEEESRMFLVTLDLLEKGGFRQLSAPR